MVVIDDAGPSVSRHQYADLSLALFFKWKIIQQNNNHPLYQSNRGVDYMTHASVLTCNTAAWDFYLCDSVHPMAKSVKSTSVDMMESIP